jgi:hypothetical protein
MCALDLEPCDLWVESEHRARTAKRCSCCGGPINVGDRYVKHFSKYDGEVTSNKMCKPCEADRDAFGEAHELNAAPESFRSILADCVSDGDDDRWGQMLAALRARGKKEPSCATESV